MKKLMIILGILVISLGAYAQDSTNPSLLRSSKAVKALNTVPYLQMAFADSSETIALSTATWAKVTNATDSLWVTTATRITENADTATISIAGDYVAYLSLDYYAAATDTIQLRLVKNHSTALTPKAQASSIGTEQINLAVSYLLPNLIVGDDFKVQIRNVMDGDDAVILNGSFLLYLIRYD